MPRPLHENEKNVVRMIAERLSPERRTQPLEDLANAMVTQVSAGGGMHIIFEIVGYERPPYAGQHSFGVDGELTDADGATLSFDLFADHNDRVLDIDLIRWEGGEIINPDWSTLKLR